MCSYHVVVDFNRVFPYCLYRGATNAGAYNRDPIDVKKGNNIRKSCITSKDSPLLDRLLEILQWFDNWRQDLNLFGGADLDLDDLFLPDPTWSDLQLTILGIVAMTRYVFGDDDWVTEGSRGRHFFLRDWNQASAGIHTALS